MNPRPLTNRKKIQLMVGLTLLAWATQTLFQQWGYGQDLRAAAADAAAADVAPAGAEPQSRFVPAAGDEPLQHVDLDAPPIADAPADPEVVADTADAETAAAAARPAGDAFVPGSPRFAAGATLELRGEARVVGAEVRLKQVCRWSEADDALFAPMADLVLTRLAEDASFESLTLPQIRGILRDAGANLAVIRFAGPTSCTVSRSDVEFDEGRALQQWVDKAERAGNVAAATSGQPAAAGDDVRPPAARVTDSTRVREVPPVRTLRSLLVADAAERLGLVEEQVEMTFNPRDEKLLKLAEPVFTFHLQPKRLRNLGSVSWDVTLTTADGGADAQTVTIAASARAWQRQVVLNRPLTFRQVIRKEDVTERRTLVDRLVEDELLDATQVVGQQAARDLKPGTVMTAKLVDAVPLAQTGQFVTVTLERGGVKVKTVARAREGGSFGQTVRVKNEATKDVYEVVLTGPQEGTLGPPAVAADGATRKPERDVASLGND